MDAMDVDGGAPPAPPPMPPLVRTVSQGGIPVYRGSDVTVTERSERTFENLPIRTGDAAMSGESLSRVWYGPMVINIGSEPWKVEKFLSYGGEGQTYLVKRIDTGEQYAAKFCSKKDSMEVRLVEELPRQLVAHENFIKFEMIVLDVFPVLSPAHHIIIMEHIPNGELFDVLASPEPSVVGRPISEGTSRRILRDIISGMAECYRFGVTHRDLKPENLLINEQGRIVIIDMGHAKRSRPASDAPEAPALARTTTANPYGTPAFNAPEVCGGKSYDCEMADVWSVATIAFYLHGKLPAFVAGGGVADWRDVSGADNETLWRKINDSSYYPKFPDDLVKFINTMWRTVPTDRPTFNHLEKAISGDAETLCQFPDLEWLAKPVNDVDEFIDELSRSCPSRTFRRAAGRVTRW